MSDTTLIVVENLSKKFCRSLKRSLWYGVKDLVSELSGSRTAKNELRKGEFWAVDNISFELKEGETLGLIGPNGSGKTTLLRILNGLIKPDKGKITVRGQMQALIALGAGFSPVLTGRENIYINASVLGIPKSEVDKRFDEIVEFSGIPEFINSPVRSYSSGMVVRLGFAVAAYLNPDILLVDEVLAVGDEGFQMKCLNKIGELKQEGTAIILVSHNMHTILTYSNRILLKAPDKCQLYDDVGEGVNAYKSLFLNKDHSDFEKICTGTDNVAFHTINIHSQTLRPGDAFQISLGYTSSISLEEIEIDVAIRTTHETFWHYQATNKTYDRKLAIHEGEGSLDISVMDLKPHNTSGRVSITVWQKNRTAMLFWWRIPVYFTGIPGSSGANFYDVVFDDTAHAVHSNTISNSR